MAVATYEVTAEDEVRKLVDGWLRAVRAGDLDRIMSHYAPDILSFDAIARLHFSAPFDMESGKALLDLQP